MKYTDQQLLTFYRILARQIDQLDTVYGWRHTSQGAAETMRKIKKLVRETADDALWKWIQVQAKKAKKSTSAFVRDVLQEMKDGSK